MNSRFLYQILLQSFFHGNILCWIPACPFSSVVSLRMSNIFIEVLRLLVQVSLKINKVCFFVWAFQWFLFFPCKTSHCPAECFCQVCLLLYQLCLITSLASIEPLLSFQEILCSDIHLSSPLLHIYLLNHKFLLS